LNGSILNNSLVNNKLTYVNFENFGGLTLYVVLIQLEFKV